MIVGAAIMAFISPVFFKDVFMQRPVLVKRLHIKQANNVFGR